MIRCVSERVVVAKVAVIVLALATSAAAVAQTAGDVVEPLPPPTGLAPHFVPATSGTKAPDADGFLQRWLLLEPISKPNRTNTLFTASYVRAAHKNSHSE